MKIFVLTKKSGPFLDPFWSKMWPILLKNQVSGHFHRNRTSDLSRTWSETGDNCFESSNGSVVSGKFLFSPFWPFLGQKYIASGDIYMVLGCFLSFSSKPLTFLVDLCYLNFVYGLGRVATDTGIT